MGQASQLDTLAERIKAEHLACDAAMSDALGHALDAGDLLIEAKAQVGWGDWEEWVVANCGVSVRRAQEYVQLARGRDKLGEAKARGSALLSIEGALKTLRGARYVGGGSSSGRRCRRFRAPRRLPRSRRRRKGLGNGNSNGSRSEPSTRSVPATQTPPPAHPSLNGST
jgi:hypothetical protein